MSKIKILAAVLTGLFCAGTLTACVTNSETGHPEGWQEIKPPADPAVVAMVPEKIAKRGVLLTATNPPFAPFEFKDSEGNLIGFELDLARAVASVMGLDFQVQQQEFALILPSIDGGAIDFGASGFTDSEERRKKYDFVDILYAGLHWAQRADKPAVDPDNACGLSIAVQRGTVSESEDVRPKSEACVARGLPPIEVLSYPDADAATTAVVVGRADAVSADAPVIAWAIERADGKLTTTGDMFAASPYGFATPKDSQLTKAVAAAMQVLVETGEYQRIAQQWNITEGFVESGLINEVPIGKES